MPGFISNRISQNSSKHLLRNLARERLQALRAHGQHQSIEHLSLLDFVPAISPHLMRPNHLAPFAALIERACEPGCLRSVVAAPPQHGKTEVVEHGLAWLGLRHPGRHHAYITYSAERSEYVSAAFQRLAQIAGLEPQGRLSDVRLKGGTEIRFTSIGGSLTGFPVDGLLVIDDPFKDRADAESPTIRRKTEDWFIDVARSRRHPKTSILCMATRWHPEDLSGVLIGRGYEYVNLKAIAEGPTGADGRIANDPLHRFPGEALFPDLKPAGFFEEEQQDAYSWSSLYQGEPRGRGASVFEFPDVADPAKTYDDLPLGSSGAPLRWSIGCDFAYTAKTHADYSVAVVMIAHGNTYYVVDVVRSQDEARVFRERVKHLSVKYPRARASAYVASTEQGGVEFIRDGGLDIEGLSAAKAGDKFTRALPAAAAWNSGLVRIPKSAPWLDAFLSEVCSFSGVKDRHDDQVDALAAAFDGLTGIGLRDIPLKPAISSRWADTGGRGF